MITMSLMTPMVNPVCVGTFGVPDGAAGNWLLKKYLLGLNGDIADPFNPPPPTYNTAPGNVFSGPAAYTVWIETGEQQEGPFAQLLGQFNDLTAALAYMALMGLQTAGITGTVWVFAGTSFTPQIPGTGIGYLTT